MFTPLPIADALIRGAILSSAALLWILALARIVGLRSFSKMTAFDFVATVAIGSLLANAAIATTWAEFAQPTCAVLAILAVQSLLAFSRQRSGLVRRALGNSPRLLMRAGEFDHAALRQTRVSEADVIAKLREANALDRSKVHAVVLESTGDISVLHGDSEGSLEQLLSDVR